MKKITLSLLSFCVSLSFTLAQKELPTENVDIIKAFDASLLESNKIDVPPALPPLDTTTKRQDYLVLPKPLTVTYAAPTLRPIGMKSGKREEDYHGYVKAGGGVPASLYGELGYAFQSGEKFDGKFWLRHHNANKKSFENQRFANTDGLVNGNLYLDKNLALEGRVGYTYDRVYYYGYDHDSLEYTAEQVRQDFKILDIGGRLYNSERTDMDLNFSAAPTLYFLTDYYSNKETGFDLNFSATKWFAEKHPLRVGIRTDFTTYNDTAKQNLNNIYLHPSFSFHADFLRLKIGAVFASNRDEFQFFPDVELNLRLWGDGLQLFAGAGGDLRKNTYRRLAEYNPFIQMRGVELRNTAWRQYFGGVKGSLGWLDYQGQAGYGKAGDLALFQTQFDSVGRPGVTRFGVVYDSANIFNIQGTVKLKLIKSLVITGTISQNTFDLYQEDEHWGIPSLEVNASAVYSVLGGKATLKGEVYLADGIAFKDSEGLNYYTGGLFDLSFGGSYRLTDNIGVFLDINNVLNNTRARWLDYPMFGLNFLGGLTARF
ncbi:MAG: TonB-dependent receptor [Saprospirales bacterium]|nr:TonB-dependent receptor [Saprospirales bacterium]